MSKELKPQIRFKGYEDEWSPKKISDSFTQINFKPYISEPKERGIFPVIQQGQNPIAGYSDESPCYDYENTIILGDHTLSLYQPKSPFLVASDGIKILKSNFSKGAFFYHFLDKYRPNTEGYKRHFNILIERSGFIPKQDEQNKISSFLDALDNHIKETEKEIDKLETLKQASLYKMFPRSGSSEPEIRFKGFTDPWQSKKLLEIATKVSDKNEGYEYKETFSCSAEHGIINQQEFFDHSISKDNKINGYYILKPDYYVYNPRISNLAPYGPINRNKTGRFGVISPLYLLFKIYHNVDYDYMDWFFKTDLWHNFMKLNGDSGARHDRFTIRTETFFQMPIFLPSIDEQQAIASYFNNLEDIISLKRRKLAKFRQIKEALLNKMFVNID